MLVLECVCVCVCVDPILLRVGLTVDTRLRAGLLCKLDERCGYLKQNKTIQKTINIHCMWLLHVCMRVCMCVLCVCVWRAHLMATMYTLDRTVSSTCAMAAS